MIPILVTNKGIHLAAVSVLQLAYGNTFAHSLLTK